MAERPIDARRFLHVVLEQHVLLAGKVCGPAQIRADIADAPGPLIGNVGGDAATVSAGKHRLCPV